MADSSVFRKASLDRLSSPEQLDQLMTVTSPRGWITLIGMGCLLLVLLLWGLLGTVPTKISSQGILISAGGVSNIILPTGGQITDIKIVPGDIIHEGEVIARIGRPDLVEAIKEARTDLDEKKAVRLLEKLELESRVVSPYTGRILEVKAKRGDILKAGEAILSLELTGRDIEQLVGLLYLPWEEGKKIIPGMEVQVAPSVVKREEYGSILGRVVSVAEYPATIEGMMQVLGNKELVDKLSGKGVPIEVRVDLVADAGTVSGYKWSSREGPPLKINSGTLCTGSITIKKEPPINLIVGSH